MLRVARFVINTTVNLNERPRKAARLFVAATLCYSTGLKDLKVDFETLRIYSYQSVSYGPSSRIGHTEKFPGHGI